MGSDSRTATASSKPRPSWRDRHLKQLTAEQFDEVKQHRGENLSVAEMAGIDAVAVEADSGDVYDKKPVRTAPPVKQAGPEYYSEDRHYESPHSSYAHRSSQEPRNNSYPEDHAIYDDQDRFPVDNRARRSDYRDRTDRPRQDVSYQYRDNARVVTRENRHEHSGESQQHYESDRAGAEAAHNNPAVETKGLVAKILDYKLPTSIKIGLMAIAIAVLVAVSLLKPIDNSSQSQLDSAFVRASIGFALAKTLNGVISVAQGTEFAVQPAGVGVNFSPGEILDPVNDLVERFSWVMFVATSSIGIQKILLEVSSWTGISVLLAGAGLFFLLTRLRNSAIARLADIAGKLLLAILLIRFLIPVGSLANDWVFKQFLQPQYEASSAELEIASARIREISSRQTQTPENDGSFADRAKRLYSSMTSKFDFDGMLDDYKQSAETVSENAINLVAVFVLQTIIFPLLFMYLIYRLFRFVVLPSRA